MGDEHEIITWILRIGIPFGIFMIGFVGYLETRFGKKQDKTACIAEMGTLDRLEVRIMRIEDKFFERSLTIAEVEKKINKNNYKTKRKKNKMRKVLPFFKVGR